MWSHLLLGPLADWPGGSCSDIAHLPLRRSLKPGGPCDSKVLGFHCGASCIVADCWFPAAFAACRIAMCCRMHAAC